MHFLVGHDRSLMILFLVANILQGCWSDDAATPPDAAAAAAGDAPKTDAAAAAATAATAATKPAEGLGSAMSAYAADVMQFGSEAVTATGEALKAVGRATLATFGLMVSMWNGASKVTAKTGELVAVGYQRVNQLTGQLPIIGTVTTGGERFLVGSAGTFRDNSDHNCDRRAQLVTSLRADLENYHPEAKGASRSAAGATPVAAAAPDATAATATSPEAAAAAAAAS